MLLPKQLPDQAKEASSRLHVLYQENDQRHGGQNMHTCGATPHRGQQGMQQTEESQPPVPTPSSKKKKKKTSGMIGHSSRRNKASCHMEETHRLFYGPRGARAHADRAVPPVPVQVDGEHMPSYVVVAPCNVPRTRMQIAASRLVWNCTFVLSAPGINFVQIAGERFGWCCAPCC